MSSILYFLIPILIISFLIVVYLALTGLNNQLNTDLLFIKMSKQKYKSEKNEVIGSQTVNYNELLLRINSLSKELKEFKEGKESKETKLGRDSDVLIKMILTYIDINKVRRMNYYSHGQLTPEGLKNNYKTLKLDYDYSSPVKINQSKTNLSYSNN